MSCFEHRLYEYEVPNNTDKTRHTHTHYVFPATEAAKSAECGSNSFHRLWNWRVLCHPGISKSLLQSRYIRTEFDRLSSNKMKAIHEEKYQEQERDVATLCLTIMIMFMVMTMYKTTSILFIVFSRTETWKGRKPFMPMTHRYHFQEMSDAEVYPPFTPTCYTTCVSTVESTCRIGVTLRSVYWCDRSDRNDARQVG